MNDNLVAFSFCAPITSLCKFWHCYCFKQDTIGDI